MPLSARPIAFVALVVAFAPAAGCAGRVVKATKMPAHYQAADISNAKTADLGRLSMPTVASDVLEPQDVVDVAIASGLEPVGQVAATPVRLDDEGIATLALVGPVRLAGLEPFAAEEAIAAAAVSRGLYKAPQVTVTMRKKAVNRITVIGAVEKQGVQELPRGQSTVLAALVAAGSLNKSAGTVIEIRRHGRGAAPLAKAAGREAAASGAVQPAVALSAAGGPLPLPLPPTDGGGEPDTFLRLDLADLDPTSGRDVQLRDGDIVRVETRDPVPVNVIGLVRKPGQYELPVNQPLRLLDAVALAGERSNPWADKIIVTRHVSGEAEPVVIETGIAAAKRDDAANIRLSPGDVVSIEETPQTTMNYIITNIFRFGFAASVPLF
jgi:polysaccharide export outer membrane protein